MLRDIVLPVLVWAITTVLTWMVAKATGIFRRIRSNTVTTAVVISCLISLSLSTTIVIIHGYFFYKSNVVINTPTSANDISDIYNNHYLISNINYYIGQIYQNISDRAIVVMV
jgi:CBS domain containing-hemolysin-like protein